VPAGQVRAALDLGDHPGRCLLDDAAGELAADDAQVAQRRPGRGRASSCRSASRAPLPQGERSTSPSAKKRSRSAGQRLRPFLLPEDHAVDVAQLRLVRVDDRLRRLEVGLDRASERELVTCNPAYRFRIRRQFSRRHSTRGPPRYISAKGLQRIKRSVETVRLTSRFSSDPSYLPEMRRRLLDLKAIRARVDAFDGATEWERGVCANGTQANPQWRFAVSGYFIFVSLLAAVVVLIGLTLWLTASVVITVLDPKNAAKFIAAMGAHFPLRRWWRQR
jgi:hypothetical protein